MTTSNTGTMKPLAIILLAFFAIFSVPQAQAQLAGDEGPDMKPITEAKANKILRKIHKQDSDKARLRIAKEALRTYKYTREYSEALLTAIHHQTNKWEFLDYTQSHVDPNLRTKFTPIALRYR